MPFGDDEWIARAQNAEAALATCRDQINRVNERFREMMLTLGAKQRTNGEVDIDFGALVARLSPEHALSLRAEIDRHHQISGAAGEKPRMVVRAASG